MISFPVKKVEYDMKAAVFQTKMCSSRVQRSYVTKVPAFLLVSENFIFFCTSLVSFFLCIYFRVVRCSIMREKGNTFIKKVVHKAKQKMTPHLTIGAHSCNLGDQWKITKNCEDFQQKRIKTTLHWKEALNLPHHKDISSQKRKKIVLIFD